MKVLLFELIRSLEFKLAVSPDDIVRILGYVMLIMPSRSLTKVSSGLCRDRKFGLSWIKDIKCLC